MLTHDRPSFDFSRYSEIYRIYPTGIFGLVHSVRQRVFVGSTHDTFRNRWNRLRHALETGTHTNASLLQDWRLDGPSAFAFVVLQERPRDREMTIYQQFWMECFREAGVCCYNLANARDIGIERKRPISMPLPDDVEWLTRPQVADYFRVSIRTIDRWIARSKLDVIDIPGGVLIPVQSVHRLMSTSRSRQHSEEVMT